MNVFINSVVLLITVFVRASAIEVLKRRGDFDTVDNGLGWIHDVGVGVGHEDSGNEMNSTVYMSVNHYYCAAEEIKEPVLILYGTKSWTFPVQDVNLTLSYPSATSNSLVSSEDGGYIISGFKVVVYVDGMDTKGYIMEGGVLKESIVLSFVSKDITSLSYEFWLYGTLKNTSELYNELNTHYFLCT